MRIKADLQGDARMSYSETTNMCYFQLFLANNWQKSHAGITPRGFSQDCPSRPPRDSVSGA